jgi:hypothetical protein
VPQYRDVLGGVVDEVHERMAKGYPDAESIDQLAALRFHFQAGPDHPYVQGPTLRMQHAAVAYLVSHAAMGLILESV